MSNISNSGLYHPNPGMSSAVGAMGAANGASGAEAADSASCPYLGVEEMMILLSTRLGALDGEVRAMMDGQQARMAERSAIKEFENAMGRYQPPKSMAEYQTMRDGMLSAIESLPVDDPIRRELEAKLASFDQKQGARTELVSFNGSKYISYTPGSKDEWVADKQSIANMAEDLGDQAEMEMLKLQSHMTKRTTLVQLTTNIVQKLEAAPDMIAKNI